MKSRFFKSEFIRVEIQVKKTEEFINLLWRENIRLRSIKRINITTILLTVDGKDLANISALIESVGGKINILKEGGYKSHIRKITSSVGMLIGFTIFITLIYYFSNFIWIIKIDSGNYTAPFEIREDLKEAGIVEGINKNKLNTEILKETILNKNHDIMWVNFKIAGSTLIVTYVEKEAPPKVELDNSPCDIVADKTAIIDRVFTSAGTAVVKPGELVKKGQLLVKGQQGNEVIQYEVHAKGEVIGRCFYSAEESLAKIKVHRASTGNFIENWYVAIPGNKLYLKKTLNNFKNYDKIISNILFFKKETIMEVNEKTENLNLHDLVEATSNKLYTKIINNLEKSAKIMRRKTEFRYEGNILKVKVLIEAEENIGTESKLQW